MLKQVGQLALGVAKSPAFWSFAALLAAIVYVCR
jgi:hypothetical protein